MLIKVDGYHFPQRVAVISSGLNPVLENSQPLAGICAPGRENTTHPPHCRGSTVLLYAGSEVADTTLRAKSYLS